MPLTSPTLPTSLTLLTGLGAGTNSTALGPRPVDISTVGTVTDISAGADIQTALAGMSAGNTLRLGAGSYPYSQITKVLATGTIRVVPATAGTVSIPGIWINGAKGIDFRGIDWVTGESVWFEDAIDCAVRGGTSTVDPALWNNFEIRHSNNGVTVEDVDCQSGFITWNITTGAATYATAPTNVYIRNNRSQQPTRDHVFGSFGTFVYVERNVITGFVDSAEHADGIQSVGLRDSYIRQNHIYGSRAERLGSRIDRSDQGIILNSETVSPFRTSERIEVSNNLVHDCPGSGLAVAGCTDVKVFNNTIVDNDITSPEDARFDADAGNTVTGEVYNNIFGNFYVNTATLSRNDSNFVLDGTGPVGTNKLTGDPGFTNQDSLDYSLTAASANKGSASATGIPSTDIESTTRVAPHDRGAIVWSLATRQPGERAFALTAENTSKRGSFRYGVQGKTYTYEPAGEIYTDDPELVVAVFATGVFVEIP